MARKLLPAIALNAAWLCAVGARSPTPTCRPATLARYTGRRARRTPAGAARGGRAAAAAAAPRRDRDAPLAAAGGPLTIFGILLYRARKAPDLAATAVARWGLVEGERTASGALKLTGLGAVAFPLAGGLHLFQFGSGASALDARRPPLQPLIQVVGALLFANAILNAMAGGLLKRRKLIVQG